MLHSNNVGMAMRPLAPQYTPIDEDIADGPPNEQPASERCCAHCGSTRARTSALKLILNALWSPTIVAVAVVVGALLVLSRPGRQCTPWIDTDFAPARGQVESERVRFTGTAAFREDGSAYRTSKPNEPQYVGTPTREIDEAWKALVGGRYFYLTEEEAREAWPDNYQEYYHDEFGYRAGLDVLHTLHCVNLLRKTLYVEYYPHFSMGKQFQRYHVDHCLDILRQGAQCHGDLTPIPVKWFESAKRTFIDSDQVHTCRDFSKVRKWATERFNGSLAVHVREGLEAPE